MRFGLGHQDMSVGPPSFGRAFAVYNAGRILLFVFAAAAVWLVFRLNGFPLLLVALLVSTPLSWFVLAKQRDAMGLALEARRVRHAQEQAERDRALDEADGQVP